MIYALTNAANSGLTAAPTLVALAVAALTLGAFFIIEHRSEVPLMPLGFLRRGTVFVANAIGLLLSAAVYGLIFMLSLYWQQIKAYPALNAGLAFVPASLIFFFVGGFAVARLIKRFGIKAVLVASMIVITTSFLLFSQLSISESYFALLPAVIIFALGGAVGFTAFTIAAVDSAQLGEEGLASGLANTAGEVGGPIGIAVVVTIIGAATRGFANMNSSDTLIAGFRYGFMAAAILTGIALVLALLIRQPKQRG